MEKQLFPIVIGFSEPLTCFHVGHEYGLSVSCKYEPVADDAIIILLSDTVNLSDVFAASKIVSLLLGVKIGKLLTGLLNVKEFI